MKKISVIVPCYNEQEAIPFFYDEIVKISKIMENDAEFEYLFINDGSKDKTINVLRELAKRDERVKYVSFSKNFGKEAAMYAGLEKSSGDYIAVMDVDLQDPPELLPEMYRILIEENVDCVATRRVNREGEPIIRSFFARGFYWLINKISDVKIVDGARDYRLMRRIMVEAVLEDGEYNRFSKGIFSWVGFQTRWLEFSNIERVKGKSKWSFWKLFRYSIEGILAYSTVPLSIASVVGIVFCIISLLMMLIIVIRALIYGDPVAGWPSLISIITFLGGVQLLCLGIIGLYLSKTYMESKGRPNYIIKEKA